jgi:hypothetical protein
LFGDAWLDYLGAQRSQLMQRADVVRSDHSAEADHIGSKDRSQPSLDESLIRTMSNRCIDILNRGDSLLHEVESLSP